MEFRKAGEKRREIEYAEVVERRWMKEVMMGMICVGWKEGAGDSDLTSELQTPFL